MINYRLLLILFVFSSCNCSDEELTLQRMEYSGNELKTGGYYFLEYQGVEPSIDLYFLYRNGIILDGTSTTTSDLNFLEDLFRTGEFHDIVKDSKEGWGVFKIFGDDIEFERWYPSDRPLETWVRAGKILNDTTFHITSSFKPDGSQVKVKDEIYRFKAFNPKPDSTNMFIP